MPVLIASDIHGSALYCGKLLSALEREGTERLILLGDILYHGPRNDLPAGYAPKQVIAMLNPLADQILCVRGNCDAEVDQMVLDFPIMQTHRHLRLFGHSLLLTHGHHCSDEKLPSPELRAGAEYLIFGHTHVPLCKRVQGLWCLNPGSVSIPKEGSWHGYMLLTRSQILWKDLDGNLQMTLPWQSPDQNESGGTT